MTPSIVQNYARHVIRNLSQNDGTLCLVLNKGDPSPLTTTPDQVKSAFGDAFVFQPMVPEIEHERHPAYFIGCGHANMSSTPDQAKRS